MVNFLGAIIYLTMRTNNVSSKSLQFSKRAFVFTFPLFRLRTRRENWNDIGCDNNRFALCQRSCPTEAPTVAPTGSPIAEVVEDVIEEAADEAAGEGDGVALTVGGVIGALGLVGVLALVVVRRRQGKQASNASGQGPDFDLEKETTNTPQTVESAPREGDNENTKKKKRKKRKENTAQPSEEYLKGIHDKPDELRRSIFRPSTLYMKRASQRRGLEELKIPIKNKTETEKVTPVESIDKEI